MLNTEEQNLHDQTDNREVLVRVENVSKKFCRSLKKSLWYGVQDIGSEMMGIKYKHELRPDEFWSVKDVSFELRRGECLGLIGRNGAGKSTLLRMLNGLIKPDRGRIEINGQVGGLIALGAGFNPILTGRENIYVNGSILGLSKAEIDAKFEEIIDFAEIGEFIDAPVQTYSSGMNVRLGFAVAAVLIKPDVLLLDEVLAVGDIGFTIKCLNKVQTIANNSAVIFVSHSMQFISNFCTEALLMNKGQKVLYSKKVDEVVDSYQSMITDNSKSIAKNSLKNIGTGEAEIQNPCLICESDVFFHGGIEPVLKQGVSAKLEFEVINHIDGNANILVYIVYTYTQAVIAFKPKDLAGKPVKIGKGKSKINIDLGSLDLTTANYTFSIIITDSTTQKQTAHIGGLIPFRIQSEECEWAYIVRYPSCQLFS